MSVNYMPAYIISNENQRWAANAVPGVKSVLTVAASGDQALFYKLAGVEVVDTFDVTCNARVIQDIKFAAIQHINRSEYQDLLRKIYHTKSMEIISILKSYNLWDFIAQESREILMERQYSVPFSAGLGIDSYPENIPTSKEYAASGKNLKKPSDFIWSDLASLDTCLKRKYDLINISNIFDYVYDGYTQVNILDELSEHLNTGGRIAYLPQVLRCDYKNLKRPKIVFEKILSDNKKHTKMVLFQKTR